MKVKQIELDGICKQAEDLKADILAMIDKARASLTNTTENVNVQLAVTQTASMLASSFEASAALAVTLKLKTSLETAMASTDGEAGYAHVLSDLNGALVSHANRLEETLFRAGPLAHVFEQQVIKNISAAYSMIEKMVAGHEFTKALCERNGINFERLQAGDKDVLKQVLDASAKESGHPIPDEVYRDAGIGVDAPPAHHDGVGVVEDQLARTLGDGEAREPSDGSQDGIRA